MIDLRPASPEDSRLVWEWQQAPGIRQFSHNKEPPPWEGHCKWWAAKMADTTCWFFIILDDGEPCGFLRYDDKGNQTWLVSILIRQDKQGQGIGTAALKLASGIVRGGEYIAEIDPLNIGSIKIFERAGYKKVRGKDVWMRG